MNNTGITGATPRTPREVSFNSKGREHAKLNILAIAQLVCQPVTYRGLVQQANTSPLRYEAERKGRMVQRHPEKGNQTGTGPRDAHLFNKQSIEINNRKKLFEIIRSHNDRIFHKQALKEFIDSLENSDLSGCIERYNINSQGEFKRIKERFEAFIRKKGHNNKKPVRRIVENDRYILNGNWEKKPGCDKPECDLYLKRGRITDKETKSVYKGTFGWFPEHGTRLIGGTIIDNKMKRVSNGTFIPIMVEGEGGSYYYHNALQEGSIRYYDQLTPVNGDVREEDFREGIEMRGTFKYVQKRMQTGVLFFDWLVKGSITNYRNGLKEKTVRGLWELDERTMEHILIKPLP